MHAAVCLRPSVLSRIHAAQPVAREFIRGCRVPGVRIGERPELLAIAIRARQFDAWVSAWLADHPASTVLHLGCGLDSRVFRVAPASTVQWFDVDYPEVIDLRRQLYPERPGYRLVGASLLEPGWLAEVPGDRPAMIVAEGVMMYLPASGAGPLLTRLVDHFPSGQMAFDAVSTAGARLAGADKAVSATGAKFGWGLDDPADVKQFVPSSRPSRFVFFAPLRGFVLQRRAPQRRSLSTRGESALGIGLSWRPRGQSAFGRRRSLFGRRRSLFGRRRSLFGREPELRHQGPQRLGRRAERGG